MFFPHLLKELCLTMILFKKKRKKKKNKIRDLRAKYQIRKFSSEAGFLRRGLAFEVLFECMRPQFSL